MSTAKEASELKQQGAVEAARDPNSSVTSDDAQKKILEESRNAGVTAFTFDPDATPEQKKAQARAVGFPTQASVSEKLLTLRRIGYT